MPVYMLFRENVHDQEGFKEYSKVAATTMGGGDGPKPKVLGVDRAPIVLEGAWDITQTVLLQFDSEEDAKAWYHSEGYQAAAAVRQKAADTDVVILHGF